MKYLGILGLSLLLILGGCKPKSEVSITTDDGSKVSTTGSNGDFHLQTTAADGTKAYETVSKGAANYQDSKGNSVDMGTNTVKESDLDGLTFYPGSVEQPNGGSMKTTSKDGTAIMCTRTTKDDPDQVAIYFKTKLESPTTNNVNVNGQKMASLTGKLKDGTEVTITASKKDAEDTQIMIIEKQTKKSS